MIENKYPSSRRNDLVIQELDDEVLIYDLKENRAFCLNETSALIWQLCNGKRSTAEIVEALNQKLNSLASDELVWFALEQLKKENLIENSNELPNYFVGMNRRQIIKKVGLGTMVALPIVAGIIAPQAIHAGSCGNVANGQACPQGNCQCQSNCCNGGACANAASIALNGACTSSCVCASGCCNSNSNSCMNFNQGNCAA